MSQASQQYYLTDLDYPTWLAIQTALERGLRDRQSEKLAPPLLVVVHDLLERAFTAMHRFAFRRAVETDFGVAAEDDTDRFEKLLETERAEHGTRNLARFCQEGGWQVCVDVPPASSSPQGVLVELMVPVPGDLRPFRTEKLAEALGLELRVDAIPSGSRLALIMRSQQAVPSPTPALLDANASRSVVGDIAERLNYGLVCFAPTGEILAASPAFLGQLALAQSPEALRALAESIPLAFLNDVVWGLALSKGSGKFENYRIRLRHTGSGDPATAVLFNVSGFRKDNGEIVSLWQVVSRDQGAAAMVEGSIIGETRVHNITRNYVPQLVEQKAREAVRLGKSGLSNERRKVAVLFCDVVGFTSYVERNQDMESIIDTLNSLLRRISASVRGNRGAIDKFMGDCVMALFDSPVDAVLAAINMQSHADDINSLRMRAGQQLLQLRIGVHWGEVVIGNVGTAERLDWTAIGDVVNTASRMEKECRPGATLISMDVREALESAHPGRFRFEDMFGIQVKGKQHTLPLCHVSLAASPGM
jgi:adenylate cyclase